MPALNQFEDVARRFNIISQYIDQMLPTVRSTLVQARKISGSDNRVNPDDIRGLTELERILVNYGDWVTVRAAHMTEREEPAWSTP
jgi:hypothetical protein